MKDEKFTFTKREIHQFLEKRRLAHDAVLAMVSSGAIKLPCANFSRSIDDDAVEKREPTKIACLNVAIIESLTTILTNISVPSPCNNAIQPFRPRFLNALRKIRKYLKRALKPNGLRFYKIGLLKAPTSARLNEDNPSIRSSFCSLSSS